MEANRSRSNSPSKARVELHDETMKAGSANCPFKLIIVGGGPAGCSIIIRAIRIGLLSDLCGFTTEEKPPPPPSNSPSKSKGVEEQKTSTSAKNFPSLAGVCIIDAGPFQRFGGGRLQDYCINSNTYVNKFVTHVIEEKPDNLPPERVKGTPLERLNKLQSSQELLKIGPHIGSLQKVGNYLRDIGQTVYNVLQAFPESSRSYHETTVQSIHRMVDHSGKFLHWKVIIKTSTNVIIEVYAKHVVMCTGGHQELPIFSNPNYSNKLMLSDHACTNEGIQEIKQRLMKNNTNISGMGRIAIIGGSHSAFSAAWICLNKLVDHDELTNPLTMNRNGLMTPSSSSRGHITPTLNTTITTTTTTTTTNTATNTVATNPVSNKLRFGTSGICILHRSSIKVFYGTMADADHDNYHEYANYTINKITGQINPFGGIRGDAKELWRNIRTSRETRIRLLQIKGNIGISTSPLLNNNSSFGGMKQSIIDKILEEAVIIIWACGYSTNHIPIYDANNCLIPLSHMKGQVNVDDQARILAEDHYQFTSNTNQPLLDNNQSKVTKVSNNVNVIENLYGSGLGYGLKAILDNGDLDGSSGRADGVAVYLKRSATLVLSHILGNKVFGGGNIKSWEERNTLLRKQQIMMTSQQTSGSNLTSLSMGSTASTVATSSSSVTTTEKVASITMLKTLGSPKRPSTTATGNYTRSLSNSRQSHRPLPVNSPSLTTSSNLAQKVSTLHKSCPESFLKTVTSNNNNNTVMVVKGHQRPSTQHQPMRKANKEAEKSNNNVSSNTKRPQSTGRGRPSNQNDVNPTAPATIALLSSTAPLPAEKSPLKTQATKPSPRIETPKKGNLQITPVTSPVIPQQSGQRIGPPTITLSPFTNNMMNTTTNTSTSSPRQSAVTTTSTGQKTSIQSPPKPNNSSNATSALPSTQKPLIITPVKSPLHSPNHSNSGGVTTPVMKSPHMPFPAFQTISSIDERKSVV